MDADGLPLIGPGIDFTKVEPISQKRTLAFLNHFVVHTAHFLNRFSCVCEEKLLDLNTKLQRIETTLKILEGKLASIPGLEGVTLETTKTSANQNAAYTNPSTTETTSHEPAEKHKASDDNEVVAKEASPAIEDKPQSTVSNDPAYAKFFKMSKMGVPAAAVKQKMAMEGLNPDLLDTPDAAFTGSSQPAGGSDSDFSDHNDSEDSSGSGFSDSN